MAAPAHWGPASWAFIHHVAAGYPVQPNADEARAYGDFFKSLPPVLPCAKCRGHLAENLRAMPPDAALAAGRADLFAWSVALHNRVNDQLGKPEISLEKAYKAYFRPAARRAPVGAAAVALAVVGLVLAALAALLHARRHVSAGAAAGASGACLAVAVALACTRPGH